MGQMELMLLTPSLNLIDDTLAEKGGDRWILELFSATDKACETQPTNKPKGLGPSMGWYWSPEEGTRGGSRRGSS